MAETSIYEVLGEEGFRVLVAGFYKRVKDDDLIGPMYPSDDWEGSEERLRDFLVGRFGGPPRYVEKRGHPRLRMRHVPFSIGEPERDRWIQLMGASLSELEANSDPEIPGWVREELVAFFAQVADFMRNRPD